MIADDTVMLIGGFGNSFAPVSDVESINPTSGVTFLDLRESMKFPRVYHTATLLPDGKVLVTGGVACPGSVNIQTVNPIWYYDLLCRTGTVTGTVGPADGKMDHDE